MCVCVRACVINECAKNSQKQITEAIVLIWDFLGQCMYGSSQAADYNIFNSNGLLVLKFNHITV